MNFERIVGESLVGFYERVPPARHQQDHSNLYLVGKVALFALSWYGTIVLESPVLAAVTVVIGVSILYDLFCMALGGGQPPARRGVSLANNSQYTSVSQKQNRVHVPVGYRVNSNSSSTTSKAPRNDTSPLLPDRHVGVGERDEGEPDLSEFSSFDFLTNEPPRTVLPNGRLAVGERDDKPSSDHTLAKTFSNSSQNMPDSKIVNKSSRPSHRTGAVVHTTRNSQFTNVAQQPNRERVPVGYRSDHNSSSSTSDVPTNNTSFSQTDRRVRERDDKPSSSGDTFAALFVNPSQKTRGSNRSPSPSHERRAVVRRPQLEPTTSANTQTVVSVSGGNRPTVGDRPNLED